jgi:hypothetical protein
VIAASVEKITRARPKRVRSARRFCEWCVAGQLTLAGIRPRMWRRTSGRWATRPRGKVHLAAIRHWMRWLTEHGVLDRNRASEVWGPKLVAREGKTAALSREQARALLAGLDGSDLMTLRDLAMIGVRLRLGARKRGVRHARLHVEDEGGPNAVLIFGEKGVKELRKHSLRLVRELPPAYIAAAGFSPRAREPLFRSFGGRLPEPDWQGAAPFRCAGDRQNVRRKNSCGLTMTQQRT